MDAAKKRHLKTILQVVPALVSGGVEKGTVEIAKKIVDSGYKSIVISAGGPLVNSLEMAGSKHIQFDVSTKNPFLILWNIQKIVKIIKEEKVDIIHARSRAPAWSCFMAAKITGVKLVTTFHGIYNFENRLKKFYNSIMTQGNVVIAVSNFVKAHIMKNYQVNENKVILIHRGVNHEEFNQKRLTDEILAKYKDKYNAPKDTKIILLPARMTQWKGQMVLIEALKKIKDLNFYCIMAGDLAKHPSYVKRIKNLISSYKIQHRVQLFGNEPDMISLYGIADIVLSTSIEPEAFGRTIIEAQAMEKLVIATNIGGAAETIENGETGFHIEPENAEQLAEKIAYCLSIAGTKKAEKITSAARRSVIEKFSLDLMLKKIMEVYDRISTINRC